MKKHRIQNLLKCRASCISLFLVFGMLLSQSMTLAYAQDGFAGGDVISPADNLPADETAGETTQEPVPSVEPMPSVEPEPSVEPMPSTEPSPSASPSPTVELSPSAEPVAVASAQTGSSIDWSKIPSYSGAGNVTNWSVAKGDGGYYFYVTGNQYSAGTITVNNADGSAAEGPKNGLVFDPGATSVKNGYWGQIEGSSLTVRQVGQEKHYEAFVPDSAFPDGGFQLTCGNSVVKSEDIPNTDGAAVEPEPSPSPSPSPSTSPEVSTMPTVPADYNGIVIDGSFDDWAAVPKGDVDEGKGWSTVEHVAVVWDGDDVFLYFAADGNQYGCGNWDSVCNAGDYNNGQYAITTDLGNQLLVQLKNVNGTPTVSGVNGATVAVNNTAWDKAPHCWEVRIPASALPKYKDTISFGIYGKDPLIKDVANLEGGGSGGTFNGVVIDGKYEDWDYYPHATIQYATAGTHENVVDSRGALWNNGGKLYAHAETTMPAHLEEAGGEFTQAVTIKINDSTDLKFAPRFIAVDAAGNINWNPQLSGLAEGEYEYYMVSLDAPGTSTNINNLTPGDEIYGRMKVTVGKTMDSCEWEMDVAKLAKHLRLNASGTVITEIDPSDIKTISVQWGRLGQQWVTTAGTSTGPLVGILLCLCACAVPAVLIHRKRRGQP